MLPAMKNSEACPGDTMHGRQGVRLRDPKSRNKMQRRAMARMFSGKPFPFNNKVHPGKGNEQSKAYQKMRVV